VTESFARAVWPGGRSVGHLLGVPRAPALYRVVGIVGDIAVGSLRINHRHAILRPIDGATSGRNGQVEIVIRSSDPPNLTESARRAVTRALPSAFDADVATGREVINRDTGRERLVAWFFVGFGVVALALGVCGVFGLVAFVAESRTREMGIRLALGARATQLVRTILLSGVAPVLAGTAAGMGVSAVLDQVVTTTFPDVRGLDLAVTASVAAALVMTAGAASLAASWPIRRVEPAGVLHAE
jgi:predicted lysophospholipase L1 biosynthesis ABC-type transport system permease subunit